ncbi:MAG: hypothetical protein ABR533_06525 [Desulfonatronovibrio sp.]
MLINHDKLQGRAMIQKILLVDDDPRFLETFGKLLHPGFIRNQNTNVLLGFILDHIKNLDQCQHVSMPNTWTFVI